MVNRAAGSEEAPGEYRRVLARLQGTRPGPFLVVMAGIHGNEPLGIEAVRRVARRLGQRRPPLAGDLIALAGNLKALQKRVRFIDLDLNRQWTPERVASIAASDPGGDRSAEDGEQRELLGLFRDVVRSARGPLYFIDLHTSSADGPPFLTVGDTLRNRRFAREFPLPVILGLEEQVDGALLELLNNHGFVTVGVEAGRHDARSSLERFEAALWIALCATGILGPGHVPDLERHRRVLAEASRDVPRLIEVRHRHPIREEDLFRMERGYANFTRVGRHELLARDRNGPIRSPEDGLILLPLYQGQGNDGFFISREVGAHWLRVSSVLRRARLHRWMRLLPGVRRSPASPHDLIVDTRVARVYPLEVFHLFGYRKLRSSGEHLVVSRRRFDCKAPREAPLL
jgi:succinylglutamate desuccinylase